MAVTKVRLPLADLVLTPSGSESVLDRLLIATKFQPYGTGSQNRVLQYVNYEPQAVGLAEKMMRFKQDISSLTLVPTGGGVFEVTVDGEKIYSKKQTGQFPDPAAIVKAIRAKLNPPTGKSR